MTTSLNEKIVFVGGIHGVGKSHFSGSLSRQLGIPHASAGELISRQRKMSPRADKKVGDVSGNQDALITAILSSDLAGSPFILDGHFCLLDSAGKVSKIPLSTFQALAPACVLLLIESIEIVRTRLRARDQQEHPAELLEAMQQAEIAHAKGVCSDIGVTLEILNSSDIEKAQVLVTAALSRWGQR